jgi:hypothetical protein
LKNKQFEESYKIIRDLEENNMNMVEPLFHYNIEANRDHDIESTILAKEYKRGALDPTKINSRFERQ